MIRVGLGLRLAPNICSRGLKSRIPSIALFHGSPSMSREGKNTSREESVESRLEENPNFKQLSDDFQGNHRHVHLRESETEQNDHILIGKRRKSDSTSLSHSHQHSHGVPNPMLVMSKEAVKKNPGVRITWIGLAINVGLAVGKFAGGIAFHSQALTADAVHAVSDMVSDFLTLISVGLASNKPTFNYPFGYGKIETVGSLAVSGILAMAGLSIGWTSLCEVIGPLVPHMVIEFSQGIFGATTHSHSHSIAKEVTDVNAAWIAGASIIVKEWIFHATKKIATETNSNVLMANAWHHRVDSLTSLVALVTITSGYFFNIQSLDAVGGLLVSALVIKAGAEGMNDAIKELIDKSLSNDDQRYKEVELAIKDVLQKITSNNNSSKPYILKDLIVLPSGPNLRANAILEAPLQRWGNVLGINEFEMVTDHLRYILHKDIPGLKKLNIEFVEEQPESFDQADHADNLNAGPDCMSHSSTQSHTHSTSQSDQYTHKH